jgi:hypothetical protein
MCRRQPGIGKHRNEKPVSSSKHELTRALRTLWEQRSDECATSVTGNGQYEDVRTDDGPACSSNLLWIPSSPICDSYVRPMTLVRICDDCSCESDRLPQCTCFNYSSSFPSIPSHDGTVGSYAGRCIVCGSHGISNAYYCVSTMCMRVPPFPHWLRPLLPDRPSVLDWRKTGMDVRRSSIWVRVVRMRITSDRSLGEYCYGTRDRVW